MAAGTTALLGAGLGTGLGIYQAIKGAKDERRANRELNDYDRQELDNAFKNIQLQTAGTDLLRDENARTSANLVDAASNSGSRSIIGAAPRISASTNNLNTEIANNLDNQAMRRDYAIAGDNARIEGIRESRDINNINALSSQAMAGRQDMWSGIMGAASGLGYGARTLNAMPPEANPTVNSVGDIQPSGVTYNTMPTTSFSPTPVYNTASNYSQGPAPYDPFAGLPLNFNPNYGR